MSDAKTKGASFTGTVRVRCDVLVSVAGDTDGDLTALRMGAQDAARSHVRSALSNWNALDVRVQSCAVTEADAMKMSIDWPGEKS